MASSSSADMMAKAAARPGAKLAQTPDGMKLGEDFPFLCEVCLGPNPYIRMLKLPNRRECKISGRPYTAFRWQPGSEARYKETIIAPEVAIAKNVCQTCLMDMEYNLPVRVRDQLKGVDSTKGAGGVQMPSSDVNKEFYWQNQRDALEQNTLQGFQALQNGADDGGKTVGQTFDKLAHLSRNKSHTPYYDRNLPKMCSFWTRQTCTRVTNNSCPYRPCCGTFRFPELASTNPDALSTLVRRLHADGPLSCMRDMGEEMEELRELLKNSQHGSRDEAIRNRYHGTKEDALAEKYLDKAKKQMELQPPEDQGVCSLWVGGLTPNISQDDLRDQFYEYGEIADVKMMTERRCALVTFLTRAAAEEAAKGLYRKLSIHGQQLKLWWAKPKGSGDGGRRPPGGGAGSSAGAAPMPPPMPGSTSAAPGQLHSLYPSMNPNAMGARPDM